MLKCILLFYLVLFVGCSQNIKVTGIIVDFDTHEPLGKVLVRTITGGRPPELDFVSTKTSRDGKFRLEYPSKVIGEFAKISVEIKKEGYLSNMYTLDQNNNFDTIYLRKEIF